MTRGSWRIHWEPGEVRDVPDCERNKILSKFLSHKYWQVACAHTPLLTERTLNSQPGDPSAMGS